MRDRYSTKIYGGGATGSEEIVMLLSVCPRCGGYGPMTRSCCGTERLLVGIPEDKSKHVLAAMRARVLMRRFVRALVLNKYGHLLARVFPAAIANRIGAFLA